MALTQLKTNKSTVPGDLPAKVIKHFAAYLAEPLADIINTAVKRGEYPQIYKFEVCTPIPKVQPTETISQLRNISGLLNFDKIMEKLISNLMVADMAAKLDPAQYGNQRGISIQHYLVKLVHSILTALDKNSKREKFAAVVSLIDWKDAFPRQCPKLGIKSFLKNGVRASLIPVLVSYFQGRQMIVKWHGCKSKPKNINGGGPQGSIFGILEYLSQSNDNADMVPSSDRFKFVDDLSTLEIIELISIGLSHYNLKKHVPSDILTSNLYLPSEKLKTQQWLTEINKWTEENKMLLNESKTKAMVFNFTRDYQFSTRLKLKGQTVENIKSTKLLGTIISDDLKWNLNTNSIIRKANTSMEILRRVASFGAPIEDLRQIYILFVRSLIEQSAVVWHSSLSEDEITSIERVQKTAVKIILGNEYKSYKDGLVKLNLVTLKERRDELCLNFAKKCVRNPKTRDMFHKNTKDHEMNLRHTEQFKVQFANNERLRKSPIIFMQNLLNKHQ